MEAKEEKWINPKKRRRKRANKGWSWCKCKERTRQHVGKERGEKEEKAERVEPGEDGEMFFLSPRCCARSEQRREADEDPMTKGSGEEQLGRKRRQRKVSGTGKKGRTGQ